MAKTINHQKPVITLGYDPATPGIALQPTPFWAPPKGMDTVSRLSRLAHEYGTVFRNMRLRDATIVSRQGVTRLGNVTAGDIMGVVNFVTSDGIGWLVRFRTSAVEFFNGTDWVTVPLPFTLTGTVNDYFTYTAYNDTLIFSNGVDGTYEWNFALGSVTQILEAPAAKYLTTFGGRVVASFVRSDGLVYPTRQQWSVKNNSRDWKSANNDNTGIGAGFEDLLSTPGGSVDSAQGVHPISDFASLVLRTRSTWQMTETGNVDAPFRFTRVFSELGTESGYSAVAIPGGLIALMNDDVYILSDSNLEPIGSRIRRTIFRDALDLAQIVGAYDYDEREYALLVPVSGGTVVWRYNRRDGGWTFDEFPFPLRWLSYTKSALIGLTIETSLGVIDDAGSASIDSEVGSEARHGMFYAGSSASAYVYKDDAVTQDDGVDSPVEAITGLMAAASPLEKTEVTEIQVEYEADVAQELIFEYRNGLNDTWHNYVSVFMVDPTDGPTMLSVRRTVIGHNLQFRLRSTTLGKLRILAFIPMLNIAQNEARG